jgi:hypothetical protein
MAKVAKKEVSKTPIENVDVELIETIPVKEEIIPEKKLGVNVNTDVFTFEQKNAMAWQDVK